MAERIEAGTTAAPAQVPDGPTVRGPANALAVSLRPTRADVRAVHVCPVLGGFFYDDQEAIRRGAVRDGDHYVGAPRLAGFDAIRMPASALAIGLELGDGVVCWGEGMSVQYAGAAGRDPVFEASRWAAAFREEVSERLIGLGLDRFRTADAAAQSLLADAGISHAAVRYGLSQAVLVACAAARGCTMAEVVCEDYGLPLELVPVPIYAQSGDERWRAADRMIQKRVDVLPHGLINNREKFGAGGEMLLDYVRWLAARIAELGPDGYCPALHLDVYGLPGLEFGLSLERMADYLGKLEHAAAPHSLCIESPADFGGRDAQVEGLVQLREELTRRQLTVRIAADEWCNTLEDVERFAAARAGHLLQVKVPDLGSLAETIEAVRVCREHGMDVFLGGSCVETDLSARVCAHVALATRPAFQLAKPGMGVDEGVMIVANEQARLLAVLRAKREAAAA